MGLQSESESRIRQGVGRILHSLWTEGGIDDSGLAAPLFDGRVDVLGSYVMGLMDNDEDDEDDVVENNGSSCYIDRVEKERRHTNTNWPPQNEHGSWTLDIPRMHCRDLSYDRFTGQFMYPNLPVLIQGLTDDWRACREWVTVAKNEDNDNDNKEGTDNKLPRYIPNLNYLAQEFGSDSVSVQMQTHKGLGPTRPTPCDDMTVQEYVDWWMSHHSSQQNQQDKTTGVSSSGSDASFPSSSPPRETTPLLYLKDWKFVAAHPQYNAYEWPIYFRDDWLNQATGHAYKFVYLGPAGTSTVLHADVLNSFSWSANVCGTKLWYLVPSPCTYLLYDCFGQRLATHLFADGCGGTDGDKQNDKKENATFAQYATFAQCLFPGLAKARKYAIRVRQERGDTIFVPSRWHHTVENIEDTLSINHNWLNRANFHFSLDKLRSEVEALQNVAREETGVTSDVQVFSGNNAQVEDDVELVWQITLMKLRELQQDRSLKLPQSRIEATQADGRNNCLPAASQMTQILDQIVAALPILGAREP
ncbi:hypothetical protein ACA910_021731 [Epithemia clementina (nom. ined.)]